jgi:glycosyltransferase involved in cell wall biosynthesis
MKKSTKNLKGKLPISVFIITKNEEDRIKYAINSVKGWVDEIIVVDSGSTDKTIEIAKECGADQILFNQWHGYGPQKTFAEKLCKNEWILNIDADEEVSPALKKEIINLFEKGSINKYSAYRIAVKFLPRFQKMSERSFGPEEIVTRLYNKSKAGFKASKVHDSVVVNVGKIGNLKHKMMHRCFRSFTHALEKINFYTSMQAEDMFIKGRCPSLLRIFCEPFWTFLRAYIVEKYIFLGTEGFLMSIIYGISRTTRLIKTREKFMQVNSECSIK